MKRSAWIIGLTCALLVLGTPAPLTPGSLAQQTTTRPEARIVAFQPGIRIDWAERRVEVDATVILRRPPIELFACSRGIREHESIVRIEARPAHLFQALGLIGLAPGRPCYYSPDLDRLVPASGQPVAIDVRYDSQAGTRTEPIESWMRLTGQESDSTTPRKLEPLPWVFAGSYLLPSGELAVEQEGTVIALVNFESALVALPSLHTDVNADLWLEPAPEHIPPEQTPCVLVFRPGPLRFQMDESGRLYLAGQRISLARSAAVLRAFHEREPEGQVILFAGEAYPAGRVAPFRELMLGLGFQSRQLQIEMSETAETREGSDGEPLRWFVAGDDRPDHVGRWLRRQVDSLSGHVEVASQLIRGGLRRLDLCARLVKEPADASDAALGSRPAPASPEH